MAANQVGWRGVVDLEVAFRRALEQLRTLPKNGIVQAYRPVLSRSSIDRLRDPDWVNRSDKNGKKNEYSENIKERLIYCIESPKVERLYDSIGDRMQNKNDKTILIERFVGEYTYFSPFYQKQTNDYKLSAGYIEILPDQDNNPSFTHRSGNWRNQEPEHVGFVYKSGSNLFLVGTTSGAIKSMTVRASSNPMEGHMTGLNLSVRASGHYDPFASKFVMVSNQNSELVDELTGNLDRFMELLDSRSPDYMWL